jgi:hypothetical protein
MQDAALKSDSDACITVMMDADGASVFCMSMEIAMDA